MKFLKIISNEYDFIRIYRSNIFKRSLAQKKVPGSSVSIESDYGQDDGRSRFDPRLKRKDVSSSLCVQTGSGPTQPPVQWVPGVLSRG
jgi:hypothetical protein